MSQNYLTKGFVTQYFVSEILTKVFQILDVQYVSESSDFGAFHNRLVPKQFGFRTFDYRLYSFGLFGSTKLD